MTTASRPKPAIILRSLIDRVMLTPMANAADGIDAQLYGDLAAILALSNSNERKQKLPAHGAAGSLLSVVAGIGFTAFALRCSALTLALLLAGLGPNDRFIHRPQQSKRPRDPHWGSRGLLVAGTRNHLYRTTVTALSRR